MVMVSEASGADTRRRDAVRLNHPADHRAHVTASITDARMNAQFKPKLLIIEDDRDLREWLCQLVRGEGWQVSEAENGRVGLARLAELTPDLILLDLMMPEMDGFEFLAELRKSADFHDVPVVVVTGAELSEEDHERLNGGVLRVIEKGLFAREELFAELQALIGASLRRTASKQQGPAGDENSLRRGQ